MLIKFLGSVILLAESRKGPEKVTENRKNYRKSVENRKKHLTRNMPCLRPRHGVLGSWENGVQNNNFMTVRGEDHSPVILRQFALCCMGHATQGWMIYQAAAY